MPAGPKKEVPKPYMSDAKFVTSEFRTTGKKLVRSRAANGRDETVAGPLTAETEYAVSYSGMNVLDPWRKRVFTKSTNEQNRRSHKQMNKNGRT